MRKSQSTPFAFTEFAFPGYDPQRLSASLALPAAPPGAADSCQGPTKKVKWTDREDQILTASIQKYGTTNWSLIASALPGRTGKQCRERWTNQLDPTLNRDNWTPQEDGILLFQQKQYGNCWSKITQFLPRRSSNAIKNRWCWLTRHRSQQQTQQPPAPPIPEGVPKSELPVDIFATLGGSEGVDLFGNRPGMPQREPKHEPFGMGFADFGWE